LLTDPGAEDIALIGPMLKRPPDSLSKNIPQIAVDGGIRFAVHPILWVGDGDLGALPTVVKTDQNETDLRFCLTGIRPWRWKTLHLLGFMGGRKDHELANLGEIYAELKIRKNFLKAVFYDEDGQACIHFHAAGEHEAVIQGCFSILVFEPAKITISGACRYPAEELLLEPLSGRGISNEASGLVKVASTLPFMLYPANSPS